MGTSMAAARNPGLSRRRPIAALWLKSITWRLVSTTTLFGIAWLVTGSVQTGGGVALIHALVTVVLYVPHELAWDRLPGPGRRT